MNKNSPVWSNKYLAVILLLLLCALLPQNNSLKTNVGIESFGVNSEGFLELNGEVLYMLVDGKREKATMEGLIRKGDADQVLLVESDIQTENSFVPRLFSFLMPISAGAADVKIEYKGAISFRGSVVGDFRVNGLQAFCFQHSKQSPPTGSKYKEATPYDNAKVQRALYYGWGGEENIFKNKNEGIVTTSLILDRIYSGGDSGKNLPKYDRLWDLVVNGESLNSDVDFSLKNLSVSVKGNKQISQSTTLKAIQKNSVELNVPKGITVVNETTGENVTGSKARVYGGEKIHLEAGLDKALAFTTGKLKSDMKTFQPMITKPQGGITQVLGFIKVWDDPVKYTSLSAKFEVRQKKINVQQIDKYSGDLLEKESYTRNIGSKYSFAPKASITKGKEKFIPVDRKEKAGTLGNKDVTIKFYYNLERSVTVNYYDNRTGEKIKESKKYKKVRGEKYTEKHPTIKDGEYTYRYVKTTGDKESGTIDGKNIVINYHYDKPLAKLALDKLQIYTEKSTKGLPVKVYLSQKTNYKTTLKDFDEKKITVALYLKDKKIVSKTYSAKELPKKIEMTIPSDGLKAAVKNLYTVKFTDFKKNDFKIDAAASELSTDGYAASEKTIKATS
ncbi:MucBP domain-containing protein, partial [Bacillus pumilus]|uniref:MucBP domain-containing protein n=1 Tax=Bacillus pumilus TaxID=1408 RepID=UPI003916D4EB